jgi:hypothetical protein
MELKLNKYEALELFDFIREHLYVVNETPFVEDLMLQLEAYLSDDAD